jgi:hypothetical protein
MNFFDCLGQWKSTHDNYVERRLNELAEQYGIQERWSNNDGEEAKKEFLQSFYDAQNFPPSVKSVFAGFAGREGEMINHYSPSLYFLCGGGWERMLEVLCVGIAQTAESEPQYWSWLCEITDHISQDDSFAFDGSREYVFPRYVVEMYAISHRLTGNLSAVEFVNRYLASCCEDTIDLLDEYNAMIRDCVLLSNGNSEDRDGDGQPDYPPETSMLITDFVPYFNNNDPNPITVNIVATPKYCYLYSVECDYNGNQALPGMDYWVEEGDKTFTFDVKFNTPFYYNPHICVVSAEYHKDYEEEALDRLSPTGKALYYAFNSFAESLNVPFEKGMGTILSGGNYGTLHRSVSAMQMALNRLETALRENGVY